MGTGAAAGGFIDNLPLPNELPGAGGGGGQESASPPPRGTQRTKTVRTASRDPSKDHTVLSHSTFIQAKFIPMCICVYTHLCLYICDYEHIRQASF